MSLSAGLRRVALDSALTAGQSVTCRAGSPPDGRAQPALQGSDQPGGVMELAAGFSFQPLPALESPVRFPFPEVANPLGPLAGLAGKWTGRGFNVIWRPNHTPNQDRFLELNVTSEQLELTAISGPIPNRGLLQPDINMFGLTYLQQISDANLNAGLHIEPGLWVAVPKTSNPNVVPTVARLASI